jgi:hypothetical protein
MDEEGVPIKFLSWVPVLFVRAGLLGVLVRLGVHESRLSATLHIPALSSNVSGGRLGSSDEI